MIRVAHTPLGDETLDAGRRRLPGRVAPGSGPSSTTAAGSPACSWDNPNRYRITKAFLDHVALVSEGAYGEKAGVLAVRAAAAAAAPVEQPATPVLDALELADVACRRRRSSTPVLRFEFRRPAWLESAVSTELPAVEDHRVGRQ